MRRLRLLPHTDEAFPREAGILGIMFLVACMTRLPALDSWWCLDDWGMLARSAGLIEGAEWPAARWLSQILWWQLLWPVFGLNAAAHAVTRMCLHGLGVVGLMRVAKLVGVGESGRILAGLLFSASPVAFTVLYWAAGIQELLAGVFAIWAIERWLSIGKLRVPASMLLATGSVFSKESGFCLPLLFISLHTYNWRNDRTLSWKPLIWPLLLLLVTAYAGSLLLGHFDIGPQGEYRLDPGKTILVNLGTFGWWLASPGPVFTAQLVWPQVWAGIGMFLLWMVTGILFWRRKNALALVSLFVAVSSVAPALLLVNHARPYMGYFAMAALALALASLIPRNFPLKPALLWILVAGSIVFGNASMRMRIENCDQSGIPLDPVVRWMVLSRDTAGVVKSALDCRTTADPATMVLFQQPLTAKPRDNSVDPADPEPIEKTARYLAIGGTYGPALLAGAGSRAFWTASLLEATPDALVFCETQRSLEFWGSTWQALLNASLIDILAGNWNTAEKEILAAYRIDQDFSCYEYDHELLALPLPAMVKRARSFISRIESPMQSEDSGPEVVPPSRLFVSVFLEKLPAQMR